MFSLHPQLAQDCTTIADLDVCRVLLMHNARFPWLILVPMRADVRELYELGDEDYVMAMAEVRRVSRALQRFTNADKMNVAALGNMVPQLHIHVIARFTGDAAWPQPVWNSGLCAEAYDSKIFPVLVNKLQSVII
jgi:diadenosine tetraphosphate (Ap4A) HIT family hydrolase